MEAPDRRYASSGVLRTFQRVHPPAVRFPESFRGGCSFGGGLFAALSRGVRLYGRTRGDSASARPVGAETGRGAPRSQLAKTARRPVDNSHLTATSHSRFVRAYRLSGDAPRNSQSIAGD